MYEGEQDTLSRSPYGERGLKFADAWPAPAGRRRSPYGERGLKYRLANGIQIGVEVALLTESVD